MESRFKFLGNVGQVIGGSATFAAPTINQTTHVTLGTPTPDQRPLLLRHRFNIARRVERIAAAEGVDKSSIYRVLLEDYGGQATRDIARADYRSIVADLDEWLEQLDGHPTKMSSRPRESSARCLAGGVDTQPVFPTAITVLLVLCAALALALAWQILRDDAPQLCLWDGKEYSVGSLTTMATSDVYECGVDAHGSPAWVPARNLGAAGKARETVVLDTQR
jgi:hypothetical protein